MKIGMEKDISDNAKSLHSIQLDILKEVIKLCDENSIIYYLTEGMLLGAIRDKE